MKAKRLALVAGLLLSPPGLAETVFQFSANVMLDATSYSGDLFEQANTDYYLRRAKLEVQLEPAQWLAVEASGKYDLDEEAEIADLFVAIKPFKDWKLLLGRFKEPAGMEKTLGLRWQYFNERSIATNVFSFPRKPGVKIDYDGKWLWAQAAWQQEESRSPYFDDGDVLAASLAVNPYRNKAENSFIHLGGHYSQRNEVELRFDNNEALIAPSYGNTFHSPNYYAENIETAGLELAFGWQKFVSQTEIFQQTLSERDGDEWQQQGYYTTLSMTVLGKPRKYRNANIRYAKKNDRALEISLRLSEADSVNFGEGDKARVISLAGNFYFKKYLKLSLQYETAQLDNWQDNALSETSGDAVSLRLSASY